MKMYLWENSSTPNVYTTYWVLGMHDQILQDGSRYYVQHYVLHPKFRNYSAYDDYDMAMVTVLGRIQFSQVAHPICISKPGENFVGEMVTVSGKMKINLIIFKLI